MHSNTSGNSCYAKELIRNQVENKRSKLLRQNRVVLIEAKDSIKKPTKKQFSTIKQVFAAALIVALSIALISDLSRIFNKSSSTNHLHRDDASSTLSFHISGPKHAASASWIGAVPTAAELYGDAASDMPTTESFDDDEDDEELDASASNEYPDNDNDNEADESYEDPDEADQESEQESRKYEHWIKPIDDVMKANSDTKQKRDSEKAGGNGVWSGLEGWRRKKRDLEDRILLASRRSIKRRRRMSNKANDYGLNDEFNVEDGDEDSWVNDGIDDIHIDPETKKAASEMSMDEKSIDSEYDPHQKADESKIVNRTKITTIAEVIPMKVAADFGDGPEDKDSTRINWRFLPPSQTQAGAGAGAGAAVERVPTLITTAQLLPASFLSIDQAQELVAQQAEPHFWSS